MPKPKGKYYMNESVEDTDDGQENSEEHLKVHMQCLSLVERFFNITGLWNASA